VRSSNPVLNRLTPETHTQQAPGYGAGYGSPYQPTPYPSPAEGAADRMTIDDVVVKTVALLGLVALAGAATAAMVDIQDIRPFWIGGMIVGLILGLVITFKQIVSPPLMIAYALAEGVFLGAVSKAYNHVYDGIVPQAVIATFVIFFVMAGLYKAKVIRATPKFTRGLVGAMIAALIVVVLRFVFDAFFNGSVLGDGGPLAIIISLAIIVIAALTFILDFDLIERAIAQGAPKRMAWLCAFGLLVTLIWVYIEVLRLLSYLRER
jgi:uncharacterized YccA/Bax inhibitor family protein